MVRRAGTKGFRAHVLIGFARRLQTKVEPPEVVWIVWNGDVPADGISIQRTQVRGTHERGKKQHPGGRGRAIGTEHDARPPPRSIADRGYDGPRIAVS
ncbi:hypothetical protein C8Q80DRAFT_1144654 [Daedaleopsis nitida]|nr:hypothetical protein C8Q80DRAFT_1144654 [Daedaleopsis nitida]